MQASRAHGRTDLHVWLWDKSKVVVGFKKKANSQGTFRTFVTVSVASNKEKI